MRVARIILIVVVVLGGLFVAADRIAVSVAQKKAAERAQATEGLSSRPKVSIEGFPFLTQAAAGKLEDVKISANDIAASDDGASVRIDSFHADLHGVKLSGDYSRAVADSADGNAYITYDDLTKAAPHGITVSYAGEDQNGKSMVKLTGSFEGAHLSVLSEVTVRGADTIGLHAQALPKAFAALGIENDVRQEIDFTTKLTHLPANIALTTVTADPEGITVDASGKDVVLAN
jgi:hypothetical protein